MIRYAISKGPGTLYDHGYFDAASNPVSDVWNQDHCMLRPANGSPWSHNVDHWARAGYDVLIGWVDEPNTIGSTPSP